MTAWGHIRSRPAILLAAAAVLGIVSAAFLPSFPGRHATLVTGVLLLLWRAWKTSGLLWLAGATALVFALLHVETREETVEHPLRRWLLQHPAGADVVAEGRVERPLRSDLPGVEPGKTLFIARRIEAPYAGHTWKGLTTLSLFTGMENTLAPGYYRISGKLRLPFPADNPGQFDSRAYDLRLGLVATLRLEKIEAAAPDAWNLSHRLLAAAESSRAWVAQALSLDLEQAQDERTVILAMALGMTDASTRDMQEPFRLSGTLHIFAVSGLHVAIVALVFMRLLKVFGLKRGTLIAILIPALFGYAFLTGLRPSAVRAALMTSVFLCSTLVHRKPDLMSSLGMSALILLIYDTNQIFAPGFQLSFGVLAAIGLLNSPLMRPFRGFTEPDPYLPKPLLTGWQKKLWGGRREFVALFTVSTAAWIGSLPFMIGHFHLVTPVSVLANVVLVPLSFFLLFTAIITLICGALHLTFLQVLLSNANFGFAKATILSAQFFANAPAGNFYLPEWHPGPRPPAEITALRLPAGAGANHLRIGNKEWLLDTGAEEHYRYTVQAYLQHRGINSLDGMVLSHSDYEHTDAAPRIFQDYRPPSIHLPAREPWRWETGNSVFRRLQDSQLPIHPVTAGDTIDLFTPEIPGAKATVLYPTPTVWPRRSDDRAMVLRLDLGAFRILWCNDAGFLAEKTLLDRGRLEELKCDVIIRNQHASDYSLLPEFLRAVRARVIVSSQQNFPPEQKITAKLRSDCQKLGITLIDQSQTGAVTMEVWPEKLKIRGFRGEGVPWTLTNEGKGPVSRE